MANNLRALRESRELSQEALADLLHIDRRTVWRWENEKIVIPESKLTQLARFFRVTAREIDPDRVGQLLTIPDESEAMVAPAKEASHA